MWSPDVKNDLEFKDGNRVLVEANILDYNWEGQSDQFGECFHMNPLQGTNDPLPGNPDLNITVRYNIIAHCNKGIYFANEEGDGHVQPGPLPTPALGQFSVHDILLDDINNTKWGLNSSGLTPQLGSACIDSANTYAGLQGPANMTYNHITCIQSTTGGVTPAASTRSQLWGWSDISGKYVSPPNTGTTSCVSNSDGTATCTYVSGTAFLAGWIGFNIQLNGGPWYQVLDNPNSTTLDLTTNTSLPTGTVSFTVQCGTGQGTCLQTNVPVTPWVGMSFTNNIATGGSYTTGGGTQTTVHSLNTALNTGATQGWCFGPNVLATDQTSGQNITWPYPQQSTLSLNSSCPTTTLTTTGCTTEVGSTGGTGPCVNSDTPDGTLGTVGFTSYTDGSYASFLPGGSNNYQLTLTSPFHAAASDGGDMGANISVMLNTYLSGVQ